MEYDNWNYNQLIKIVQKEKNKIEDVHSSKRGATCHTKASLICKFKRTDNSTTNNIIKKKENKEKI